MHRRISSQPRTVNQAVVASNYRAVSSQRQNKKEKKKDPSLVWFAHQMNRFLISLYTQKSIIHSLPSEGRNCGRVGGLGWTVGGSTAAIRTSRRLVVVRSAGRSVGGGGGGGAAAGAEVGDAVHALVHRRVGAEAGLDAVPAGRVAPAGRRVKAPALRRVRLGAPAAVVAARPRPRRRLPPAR